ncbi:MAG: ADP-ribosylglycohydrolase family protein [Verrucomicrobia bacterium]|nr:MAG: ADP-ribosylglycohydrolase family protein [Verrucomicrobiota bacterium]
MSISKKSGLWIGLLVTLLAVNVQAAEKPAYRRIAVKEYRDKMKGGWIGQIAGVCWGAPTEFKYRSCTIGEEQLPKWEPGMINNAFDQDDIFVEMTFLRTMEQYGLDCSIRQAGIDFANSRYDLACANYACRENMRRDGIAPPDSGHPSFNKCSTDIDYQIEADYSGLIAPGLPNVPIAMGEKFGRIMNYGDGIYGGQFIGAMYTEAFFEKDIVKVIEAGLKAIPAESQYAEMVRDMLKWSKEIPNWKDCWQRCEDKYRKGPEYNKAPTALDGVECKINGAYVLMGLLYGKGDLDQTIKIACQCGEDSDCNPSSAGGVLFATLGFSKLPERFSKELNEKTLFSFTAYNVPGLLNVCEKLARQAIVKEGGKIEKNAKGEEFFVIPTKAAKPSKLELAWAPGPITGSKFTEAEMAQITVPGSAKGMKAALDKVAPGWSITNCNSLMDPGLRPEELGRKNVIATYPKEPGIPCVLSRKLDIPAGKKTLLKLTVGHHPLGDWDLIVKADGKELLRKPVGKTTATKGWLDVAVDLSEYKGKSILLELLNQPTDWNFESGYWEKILIESK